MNESLTNKVSARREKINFWVRPEEKLTILKYAEMFNLDLSAYCRFIILNTKPRINAGCTLKVPKGFK